MSNQEPEAGDHPLPEKALKELFAQSHDRGRSGLPVMSLSMGRGLVPRNQDERRVETSLGYEEHRLVRAGELAYNMMRMWQGVCSLADEDCLVSPAYVVVCPLDGMEPKFSEYLLTYEETVAQFKHLSFGVVDDRLRLYYKDFERVRVRLPSPAAQKKIAKILATLDNLIEKTEALIAKYQLVKQGMMHDLFTRGMDEHGHLRPSHAEAPDLYKPSPLGWIPKAWEVDGLKAKGSPSRAVLKTGPFGSSLKEEHWIAHGVPVVTIGALGDGSFIHSELLSISVGDAQRLRDYALVSGDIVFSRVADVGRSVVVSQAEHGWIMSSNLMRVSLGRNLADPYFTHLSFAYCDAVRLQIRQTVNTGGREVANGSVMGGLRFLWPPIDEQCSIAETARNHASGVLIQQQYLQKLKQMKSGLLQDLMSGKVRVQVDPAEGAFDA